MASARKKIECLLILLMIWVPLLDGGTSHYGWVASRFLVLAMLIVALWSISNEGVLKIPRRWPTFAIGLLGVLLVINAVRAAYGYPALQWLINYAAYAVVFIAAATLSERAQRSLFIALVAVASSQAVMGIVEYLAHLEPRANGSFFNPNFYGGFLAAVAVWVFGGIIFRPPGGGNSRTRGLNPLSSSSFDMGRFLELLALPLLIMGVFFSESRGAFLGLFAGFSVVCLARWGWGMFPVMSVLALSFLVVPNPLARRLKMLSEVDIYAWSRIDIWKSAASMIAAHPAGIGPGMYKYYSPRFAFPVEDAFARYGQVARKAHSFFLDVAAELSPLGMITILALCVYLLWVGFIRARAEKDGRLAGAMGAFTMLLVHGAVDSVQKSPPMSFVATIAGGFLLARAMGGAGEIRVKVPARLKLYSVPLALVSAWAILSPALGFAFSDMARRHKAQPEVAARWLQRALVANPGNADLWSRWGYLESFRWQNGLGDGHFNEAMDAYEMAIKLNPLQGKYYFSMADILTASLDKGGGNIQVPAQSLTYYKKGIALEPYNPFARVKMGLLLKKAGRNEQAEEQFRAALNMEPNYIQAMTLLADSFAERGAVSEALELYKKALDAMEHGPPAPRKAYVKAMLMADKSKIEGAIEKLEGRAGP